MAIIAVQACTRPFVMRDAGDGERAAELWRPSGMSEPLEAEGTATSPLIS